MTGKYAEDVIFCILKERGYRVERQVDIGLNIYDEKLKVDFFIHGVPGYEDGLIVESKWQGSTGTVDEKYGTLWFNIAQRFPCPAIVVLAGGGMRPGAIRWFKGMVDGQKLVGVFTMEEFISWSMDNLR